jgi:tetratricopeptide (TPR) repeat protein
MPTGVLLSAVLVGFLPQGGLLVLETRSDGEAILRTVAHDLGRSTIVARDRPSSVAEWILIQRRALGASPPTPLAKQRDRWQADEIELLQIEEAPLGGRRHVEIVARRGDRKISVWRMPALARVEVGPIYRVPGTDTIVVSYAQKGRAGLDTIDLRSLRTTFSSLDATAAYHAGELERAAAIWEEAARMSPAAGDVFYNLACVHARMGQTERAKGELSIALDIDRTRYRALARDDDDLESLREDPEVRRWLRLEEED